MKNLIEAVEEWIDLRIFASSKNAIFEAKFNEMAVTLERADRIAHSAFVDVQDLTKEFKATEELHIRDANRIASLELTVMRLNERLLDTERNVIIQADGEVFSVKERMDALESTLDDHESTLDDHESKIDDLESVVEDKVDRDEVEDMIESNDTDIDLDTAAMDAVMTVLSRENFKLTVEQ
jgi:hypothetical protein